MAWLDVINIAEQRLDFVTSIAVDGTALDVRNELAMTSGTEFDLVIATWNHGGAGNPYEPHINELDGLKIIALAEEEDRWSINGHHPGEAHHPGCTCYWSTEPANIAGRTWFNTITSAVESSRRGSITFDGSELLVDDFAGDAFIGPGADAGATPSPFSSARPIDNSETNLLEALSDFGEDRFREVLADGLLWTTNLQKAFDRVTA